MSLPINRFSSQKVSNHTFAVISKVILPDKILNLFKVLFKFNLLNRKSWVSELFFFSFVFLCLNFILVPFD